MRRRREPPTPAGEEVLAKIKELRKPGVVVTQALLAREMDLPPNTIANRLNRLQRDGWIRRPKARRGLARAITILRGGSS